MKSEHRHELKTNELGRLAMQAKPFLEQHSNGIIAGACVVAAGLALAAFFAFRTSPDAKAWSRLYAAGNAEDFASVADDFETRQVGAWARLLGTNQLYQSGVQKMFSDRVAADSDLKKAREGFEGLLGDKQTDSYVRERALFGLARTLEATSGQNVDEAIDVYNQLLNDFPETSYKPIAERQIAALQTGESKEFYAWFQQQKPKPEDRKGPNDGGFDPTSGPLLGGTPPVGEITLPDIPWELQFPDEASSDENPTEDPAGDSAEKTNPAEEKADVTNADSPEPAQEEKPGEDDKTRAPK